MPELLVDPDVSKRKFQREVDRFRELDDEYFRRGWWMLKAEYPEALFAFASPTTKPPSVVFGALLDFSNYDLRPPSVRLVDPFTRTVYSKGQLPVPFLRGVPVSGQSPNPCPPVPTSPTGPTSPTATSPTNATVPPAQPQLAVQPLMQAYCDEEIPFLCLPGVREYHENPAHTGDSWLLHRGRSEGTLHFIIEQLSRYGLEPVHDLGFAVRVQVQFQGFTVGQLPT